MSDSANTRWNLAIAENKCENKLSSITSSSPQQLHLYHFTWIGIILSVGFYATGSFKKERFFEHFVIVIVNAFQTIVFLSIEGASRFKIKITMGRNGSFTSEGSF